MTDIKKIFHSFGINELINASKSGLLLFKNNRYNSSQTMNLSEYTCTVANLAVHRLVGCEQLSGKSWKQIFGILAEVQGDITEYSTEVYFESTGIWCGLSNVAVDTNHFLCTLTDITARKELERRERQALLIMKEAEQTMEFGSWKWEIKSGKVEISDGIHALFGKRVSVDEDEVASFDLIYKFVHPDDLENFREVIDKSVRNQLPFNLEYRVVTSEQEERHFVSKGHFETEEGTDVCTALGTTFDVTSIKNMQDELERKVEELNRSNLDLEQFAYVASHDLQEPLRKIVSFGERLESRSKGALDEEMSLYLSRILNATRRMQDMITNLLEFSRVARAKDSFVPTDLNIILKSVLSDLEIAIQKKDAVIEYSALPTIEAIPAQMSQLFLNLLSNSLKFTKTGVVPEVSIKCHLLDKSEQINYGLPSRRRYTRITFSDNGIGFENQDSGRIFTLFQRLRGRSEYEGAGIGLSVCKKVVDNHSGLIMASGVPDTGAMFTLILPLAQ